MSIMIMIISGGEPTGTRYGLTFQCASKELHDASSLHQSPKRMTNSSTRTDKCQQGLAHLH